MGDLPDEPEAEIQHALSAGDMQAAARAIFARYGRDVLAFLIARLRSREDGQEAYAMFSEDLWRGLPGFERRCSVRCWAYTLARNAANRHALARARRPERNLRLSEHPSALERATTQRSATQEHLRTSTKQRVRGLRERLSVDDQTLLMLHVDRGLPFRELAPVLHGAALDGAALERETQRLRKRFERIKRLLRQLAVKEGLLER